MEYSKLVAVTGLPGLYELVNSKADGAIVRSLEDNSTKFASSRIHNFSHLESIEVYTIRENVNLVEIFQAMEKAGGSLPDGKDNAVVKKYFEKTYPDLDFERVYASDLKKMVKWFDILKKKNVEIKLSEVPEEEPAVEEEVEAEKPAKKAAKKSAPAKAEKEATTETKEKPVKKKAAAKKTTEDSSAKSAKEETPKKKAAPKKK
ncbi:DUF5606 family protein [Terrimonas alba]|uniref:DUF5606 family protein n=1 Tax=Terrimonas alba TaxID=3349636 RepID=UPI0035F3DA12